MMCGAIAGEKERGSLSLLLLTPLTPGEIILQKYLGGLVPMFSFLLLSLPLGGLAYSLGGVSADDLLAAAIGLVLAALWVGAVSLYASVWCRSVVGAYLLACALAAVTIPLGIAIAFSARIGISRLPSAPRTGMCVIALGITFAALLAARGQLIRRAFLPTGPPLSRIFGRLDGLATRANRALARRFARDDTMLPDRHPIVWLEATRSVLAQPAQVVRFAVLLVCVLVPIGLFVAFTSEYAEAAVVRLERLLAVFGSLVVLGVTMLGASAFAAERANQTLDVLLSTPLTAAQMMGQKASVMHRLVFAGLIPLVSLMAITAGSRLVRDQGATAETFIFILATVGSYLINVPLVWWLALRLSIRVRGRLPAMMWALGGVFAFVALPSFTIFFTKVFAGADARPFIESIAFFSPPEMLRKIAGYERHSLHGGPMWMAAPAVHLMVCGALLCAVQQRCLRRAEDYLRG
jgi:ABC-type transport system involved in multi-copper enzyme maturation permease subunit